MSYCTGCGRPADAGDHAACERRQRLTDPPRFCSTCGRKLVVQVLPMGWTARCVKCGDLSIAGRSGHRGEGRPSLHRTDAPHAGD